MGDVTGDYLDEDSVYHGFERVGARGIEESHRWRQGSSSQSEASSNSARSRCGAE